MIAVQITTRDMPISPALETLIRKKAEKLTRFYDRIMACRVVIELPQKHKHQGKLYNVRIDLTVPRKELVVTRKLDQDIYIAVRDAFHAIQRKLENFARKQNGRVKVHDEVMHGFIVRLNIAEGFGFIEGVDSNEYYFGVTNVSYPGFDKLEVGDAVLFLPQQMNDGQQAHRVVKDNKANHKQ